MSNEQLAIIKDINVGVRDFDYPICWFTVEIINGAALQILSIAEMEKIIKDSQCYTLKDLNGKPCIVEVDGNSVKFKSIKK
jgi:hypothetical protein